MGGGVANKKDANKASSGAFDNAAYERELAQSNQAKSDKLYDVMWGGPNTPMNMFLHGDQLNESTPTGVYRRGYDEAVRTGERELDNATRQGITESANRGFGPDASASLDNIRKTALAKAGMKAGAFTDAAMSQHNEALNNFWGAAGAAGDTQKSSNASAVQSSGQAGQTYSNIYGTAGQYHQGVGAQLAGAAMGAGGMVGAAAVCPSKGSLITLRDEVVRVEKLVEDMPIEQIGGRVGRSGKTVSFLAPCVTVTGENGVATTVSSTHAFMTADGGYVESGECLGETIKFQDTTTKIVDVKNVGDKIVYVMHVGGNHTYMCDGFWSLE